MEIMHHIQHIAGTQHASNTTYSWRLIRKLVCCRHHSLDTRAAIGTNLNSEQAAVYTAAHAAPYLKMGASLK